jgi:outer membrane protein assembly factor BamB
MITTINIQAFVFILISAVSISSCQKPLQKQSPIQTVNKGQVIKLENDRPTPIIQSTYRSSYNRCGVVSIDGYQPNSVYSLNSNYYHSELSTIWEKSTQGPVQDLVNQNFGDDSSYRSIPFPIVYQNLLIRPIFDGRITFFDITSSAQTADYACYKELYTLDSKVPIRGTPSFDFPFLYFGSTLQDKPNFFCFNWNTKKIDWSIQLAGEVYSSPVITKDSIFVASSHSMYCLDRGTGKIRWQVQPTVGSLIFSNPSFEDHYVYFMDTKDDTNSTDEVITIHALDPSSGKEVWSYELKMIYNYFVSSLMVENGFLVVATLESIFVLDAKRGSLYWEIPFRKDASGKAENEPIVLRKGKIYVVNRSAVSIWNISSKQKEIEFAIADTAFGMNDLIFNEKENALYCSGIRSRSEYGSWSNDGVGYIAKISLDEKKLIWSFDYQSPHHKDYAITILLYNAQILACEIYSDGKEWKETLYVYK